MSGVEGDNTLLVKIELSDGCLRKRTFDRTVTVQTVKEYFVKKHANRLQPDTEYCLQVLPASNNEVIVVEFITLLSLPSAATQLNETQRVKLKLITKKEAEEIQARQPHKVPPLTSDKLGLSRSAGSPSVGRRSRRGETISRKPPFRSSSREDIPVSPMSEQRASPEFEIRCKPSKSRSLSSVLSPRRRSATVTSNSRFKQMLSPITRTASRDTIDLEAKSPPQEDAIPEDWADETESDIIAPKQFAFHTEVGDKLLPPENFISSKMDLEVPPQLNLYEIFFVGREHSNYIGMQEGIGPIIISLMEDKDLGCTRCLLRTPSETEHLIEYSQGKYTGAPPLKVFLAKSKFDIARKSLKKLRNQQLEAEIKKYDESHLIRNYKFGVLYCKEGQKTEDEWFGNECGSPEFDTFLDIIGNRIDLEGWTGFRGGLDVRGGTTGKQSVFLEYKSLNIMYHVSTLLPYMEADEQKIERKRHIGNDIVVIIYIEGDFKFTPQICKSVFNHVYVVVKQDPSDPDCYIVGFTIKDGVKKFGPSFPFPAVVHKSALRTFLVTKMLNGEWAAYRSLDFAHKFKRTRKMQLSAIAKEHEEASS